MIEIITAHPTTKLGMESSMWPFIVSITSRAAHAPINRNMSKNWPYRFSPNSFPTSQ